MSSNNLKLYTYYRSSAAYRVRIALNLKSLEVEHIPVHLVKDGGEQHSEAYKAKNPQGLVPMLETEKDGLTQSLAIIEYLEARHPQTSLLPSDDLDKAKVRALALSIACDIHPLNNLRVLKHLGNTFGASDEQKAAWYRHWIEVGFAALEQTLIQTSNGKFCFADSASIADCCLIPQVYNARRFDVDLDPFPTIKAIDAHCSDLSAFKKAHPAQQADAE